MEASEIEFGKIPRGMNSSFHDEPTSPKHENIRSGAFFIYPTTEVGSSVSSSWIEGTRIHSSSFTRLRALNSGFWTIAHCPCLAVRLHHLNSATSLSNSPPSRGWQPRSRTPLGPRECRLHRRRKRHRAEGSLLLTVVHPRRALVRREGHRDVHHELGYGHRHHRPL